MKTSTDGPLKDSPLKDGHLKDGGSRLGRSVLAIALLVVGLPLLTLIPDAGIVVADPADNAGNVSQSDTGVLTGGSVPDGTCSAHITATGGGGGSSGLAAGNGGLGGAAAIVDATVRVLPGQSYSGSIAGGGITGITGSTGGGGVGGGGDGGTIVTDHRGAGGGGRTVVAIGGLTTVVAGGGGGGGGAHDAGPPLPGNGGPAGTAVGAGTAGVGTIGSIGVDNPASNVVGGGQGGQAAAGGVGGENSAAGTAEDGVAGDGTLTGTGGNGGPDSNYDSGGGGGAGYTGGGGGASTVGSQVTGAGGGGGSSWVVATSPVASGGAPTAIAGDNTAQTAQSTNGVNGSVTIDWVPCQYDLVMTKTVATSPINAGNSATWTVTIINNGPDAMTRGDTISLADTLPTGPNAGTPGPDFNVVSITTSGGSNTNLLSDPVTCTGVGSSMPASTVCSRPYAPAAGTPGTLPESIGTRGLNVGETLTIVYEQVIANTAACATITNTATITDRPTLSGSTDIVGVPTVDNVSTPLAINCYDLSVSKVASPLPYVALGGTITWTVTVTNLGPGSMNGPIATDANPLVVTDVFPSTDVDSALLISATGPAGACSLVTSTVTCATGLPASGQQVLTFTQTVSAGATDGAVVSNTATVTDPRTGDSNDSSTASTTVRHPRLTLNKTIASRVNAADQFVVSIVNGGTTVGSATTTGAATSASTGVVLAGAGTYTLSEAMAPGSVSTIGQYANFIACANANATSTTVLPSGSGTSFTVSPTGLDDITCTFTNDAAVYAAKTAGSVVGPDAAGVYQVSYSVEVTNPGTVPTSYGPLVDTPSFDPNLIATGASWTTAGPGAPAGGSAGGSGPYTLAVAGSAIDSNSIQTFTVTISFTFATYSPASACAGPATGLYNEMNLASGDATPGDNSACVPPPPPPTPTINVVKSALPTSVSAAGQVVAYSFLVTNTGNVSLTAVAVTDPLPGLSAVSCSVSTLAPSVSTTCTASYTVTQDDVDAGSIANTATATGTPPVGPPVTDTGSATVTATKGPAVSITKSTTSTGFTAIGEQVPFTLTALNTGNVTLTNVVITDPNAVIGTCTPAAPATLAPGQSISCAAVHTVTQADLTALVISNIAYVAAESGVADASGTSNIVVVPGALPPALPRTGFGIDEPLELVGLLLVSGLLFLIVSKRRRQFYLVLPPLR